MNEERRNEEGREGERDRRRKEGRKGKEKRMEATPFFPTPSTLKYLQHRHSLGEIFKSSNFTFLHPISPTQPQTIRNKIILTSHKTESFKRNHHKKQCNGRKREPEARTMTDKLGSQGRGISAFPSAEWAP